MKKSMIAVLAVWFAAAGFCEERILAEGRNPAFSPDGRQILYRRTNDAGDSCLFRYELSSGKAVPIPAFGKKMIPSKSGRVFVLGDGLFPDLLELNTRTWTVQGAPLHRMLCGEPVKTPEDDFIFPTDFSSPDKLFRYVMKTGELKPETVISPNLISISPNGTIAVIQKKSGNCMNFELRSQPDNKLIYCTDSKTGIGCHSPAFSSDGRYLVYVKSGIQPLADLYVLDLAAKRISRLTSDQADNQSPSFSPDRKKIVFCSLRGSSYRILLADFEPAGLAWEKWKSLPE